MLERFATADEVLFGSLRKHYIRALDEVLVGCDSLLDVGCGSASPIRFLSRRLPHTTGLDAFAPAVESSRALGIHDDYAVSPLANLDSAFGAKTFDAVATLDVIEHLRKPDGHKLLADMERVARKRVIVFTTNGFVPQPAHSGNAFQEHLSGWSVEEFESLGFTVYGINGWKPLRGILAVPRFWPRSLWARISLLTQPAVYRRPSSAFQILAVKNLPSEPLDPLSRG